jgi:hypothetical protein
MDTCLHEKRKVKAVEKGDESHCTQPIDLVARPTGHHLASYRLGQVSGPPRWPYKYPPPVEIRTHTPQFGNSTCKALILRVVARLILVGRVARLWGLEALPVCREPSSLLGRGSSIEILRGPTGFLNSSLLKCRRSAEILWIPTKSLSLSTLGEVGVPACRDHSTSMPQI